MEMPVQIRVIVALLCLCIRKAVGTGGILGSGSSSSMCNTVYGSTGAKKVTLIFFADDGTYSGTDEAKFLLQNMVGNRKVTAFDSSCTGGATFGRVMGQPVMIITSGIGPMQAQSCVQMVMTICPERVKDAFYMGTSAFPSAIGGLLNPPQCNTTNTKRSKGQVLRIGDLCIPSFAVNWDCRQADWTQQAQGYPNVCSAPQVNSPPDAEYLYGKCLFTGASGASFTLAEELASAARSEMMMKSMPPRIDNVEKYSAQYWQEIINGTGDQYYVYPEGDRTVNVFDYKQCVEVDTNFFWAGVPWEWEGRHFAAFTMNKGFKTTKYHENDIVYANAMEGIGFSMAMENHNRGKANNAKIPYTMMRANSNYSHKPIKRVSAGVWAQSSLEPDFASGYAQAIQSFSNAMLTMMRLRCQKNSKNPKACQYTMSW